MTRTHCPIPTPLRPASTDIKCGDYERSRRRTRNQTLGTWHSRASVRVETHCAFLVSGTSPKLPRTLTVVTCLPLFLCCLFLFCYLMSYSVPLHWVSGDGTRRALEGPGCICRDPAKCFREPKKLHGVPSIYALCHATGCCRISLSHSLAASLASHTTLQPLVKKASRLASHGWQCLRSRAAVPGGCNSFEDSIIGDFLSSPPLPCWMPFTPSLERVP